MFCNANPDTYKFCCILNKSKFFNLRSNLKMGSSSSKKVPVKVRCIDGPDWFKGKGKVDELDASLKFVMFLKKGNRCLFLMQGMDIHLDSPLKCTATIQGVKDKFYVRPCYLYYSKKHQCPALHIHTENQIFRVEESGKYTFGVNINLMAPDPESIDYGLFDEPVRGGCRHRKRGGCRH